MRPDARGKGRTCEVLTIKKSCGESRRRHAERGTNEKKTGLAWSHIRKQQRGRRSRQQHACAQGKERWSPPNTGEEVTAPSGEVAVEGNMYEEMRNSCHQQGSGVGTVAAGSNKQDKGSKIEGKRGALIHLLRGGR